MALAERDRIEINDLINRHGHLVDAGELDRMGELFTADVTYDVSDFGLGALHGPAAVVDAARALGEANPVGHHVTNIVITPVGDGRARVRSKGIGIKADGTAGSVTYEDVVTRRPDGWKISHRKVIGRPTGPRAVLARLRQAAIDQSVEAMTSLYAVDAVHEFPFTQRELPSRLAGRDEIVRWIAEGWRTTGLRFERYRTLAVHDSGPDTIIVEQEVQGTSTATGEFTLPNLMVLTVRQGQIAHLRDYVDIPAALAAIGG
jgi:ketosteroid isomerase-like protein